MSIDSELKAAETRVIDLTKQNADIDKQLAEAIEVRDALRAAKKTKEEAAAKTAAK